jgi:streptogramin lyase
MGGVHRVALGVVLAGLVGAGAAPAGAVTINEYPAGPPGAHGPRYIKAGPDGNLYFADGGSAGGIERINLRGEVSAVTTASGQVDLAFGPDGTLFWAGDRSTGKRLPDGEITERVADEAYASFVSPAGEWRWTEKFSTHGTEFEEWCGNEACIGVPGTGRITGLGVDAAGNWWAAFYEDNSLRELSGPENVIELPAESGPARMVLGPDHNLWVTMSKADRVDRIGADGSRHPFPLPPGSGPNDIAVGPEGALWITEYKASKIARMTTSGVVTEYPTPTPGAAPIGITAGPDGALWFTEALASKIGRLVPDPLPAETAGGGGGSGGGPVAGGAPGTSPANAAAPKFTRSPAFHPSRFRSPASRHSATLRRGSVLTLALSKPAALNLRVATALPGRRVGRSCVAPSKSTKTKARCTRYVTVGALTANALAGANNIPFSGRVAGHALKAGPYRLTAIATDSAGNGSAPAMAFFSIAP